MGWEECKARFPLPELTARVNGQVDGWPVSITRQHGPCWRARVSTSRVDGPCWRVMETGHPSTWPLTLAVNSGSGNRALHSSQPIHVISSLPSSLLSSSISLIPIHYSHSFSTLHSRLTFSTNPSNIHSAWPIGLPSRILDCSTVLVFPLSFSVRTVRV